MANPFLLQLSTMPLSSLLLPPSRQFWPDCAQQVIAAMQPDGNFADASRSSELDFSALRVIVPAYEHASLLIRAMAQQLNGNFIPPRINTLSAWLALQIPAADAKAAVSESERLMALYAQLREHGWLKKLFSARKNTDLLPLAQTLLTLSDELTQAMLPLVVNETGLNKNLAQAEQVWHQALASLPMPVQQVLSDEAQLVWQIWTSQLDGQDAISLRFQKMLRLAEHAPDPLLWLNPVVPDGLEQQFLTAYAKKQAVQVISLDWRATKLANVFSTAWQEVVEKEDEPPAADALVISAPLNNIRTLAADSLEQEAQLGAQTILDWLQQGKTSIALIAQDRVVARRIRALLERAQVHVSDETGWKLSTTRAAAALAAWFDVVVTRADTVMLLDLLKSPYFEPESMAAFDEKTSWVMAIEMALLRANVVGGWDSIIYALGKTPECAGLLDNLKSTAGNYTQHKSLTEWLTLTQQTLREFGISASWQQDAAGQQVAQLLEKLREDCSQLSDTFSFAEWRVFINLQLESTALQGAKHDQRVLMLPLNGARLRSFDAVLMAGCDAAHLPSQPKEVLFFTNAVRRECGLITHEQRQRQQLRDFAELLSANSDVVLSWQSQQRGEENPVSPWLERLNLCLQRAGLTRLETQQVQLSTQSLPTIIPQQPKPAAASLQPANLSASGYNSFLACPYQFFATRMLGLSSIDTLSDMPEKRDYGGWLHAILKTYHDSLKAQPELYPAAKQEALLREISQTMFTNVLQKSPAALGYSIRWEKVIPAYVAWSQRYAESGWQFEIGEVWLERSLEWADGQITLRGQIDRMDVNQQGEHAVLDYKTTPIGALNKKLKQAEDQQLPFYGLLAATDEVTISSAHYVALEMTGEKLADASAANYAVWQQELQQAIIQNVTAIGQGAALPAQGISQVCQYCEVRGLCRKGAW
ncbi:PD-(D/E)XK nuclease family protein [Solimicrobium silvestre]|uniref:PD-(D/E)XK nuclease superfamily n=1 Tax=Solimicrobium silvestre TaxID=2099400 RepID=A0A2S9GWJ8_9BURK|nr:PD-(D/E)XK nuclease family protein [Solimicrobium silvestre]PRC92099.1 PD-(D/E)XK nuclease superfamily [Solimicrobium silvestre]